MTCCDIEEMPGTKRALLEAVVQLMLAHGYTATTVDQICAKAGVTKGGFFHYFRNKEEIARAALDFFSCRQTEAFASIGFDKIDDPIDRLRLLFDGMEKMCGSSDTPDACLVGMMAQELAESNDAVRGCCEGHFGDFADMIATLLKAAKKAAPNAAKFDPKSVAWMTLSLMQGSMLVGKTKQDRKLILQNLRHARSYIDSLLGLGASSN